MKKSSLFVFMSAVFFATGGLFFKICTWEAMAISSARSILAGVMILIIMLCEKHRFVINKSVILAAISISATNNLYALANKLTTAGNTIVLQFSMPVFVILIMAFLFKKKPTKLEVVTCIVVLAGIICFFIDSLSAGNMLGNALALISGFTYAGFFIFNSREDSEPFTAILLSYALTSLIGLPWLVQTNIAATPVKELLAVLALGLLQQGAAQICFAIGIKKTPAVAASLISGIEPVLNPVLAAVFYGEMLSPLSVIGAVIVL
ncbi:MAG: DMT family transporter, partial [Clostridia bacterium]|nr:DMT family transporter [Clostridia bacterium]